MDHDQIVVHDRPADAMHLNAGDVHALSTKHGDDDAIVHGEPVEAMEPRRRRMRRDGRTAARQGGEAGPLEPARRCAGDNEQTGSLLVPEPAGDEPPRCPAVDIEFGSLGPRDDAVL